MLLNDAREAYYSFSGKLGDIIRQLSAGGIALVWLFKDTSNGATFLTEELYIAIYFLVASLGIDVLQYVYATFIWGVYHRCKEKKLLLKHLGNTKEANEASFEAPGIINVPTVCLLWLKAIMFFIGYFFIFLYLQRTIFH
ncbi:hypothetical protein ACTZGI_02230 [Rahnella aceris]|uniref:hypothetical protein n=1 Tax=Rahnella sp. (strain Y9602) TaxID=2703885 RepID=UPI003FD64373